MSEHAIFMPQDSLSIRRRCTTADLSLSIYGRRIFHDAGKIFDGERGLALLLRASFRALTTVSLL